MLDAVRQQLADADERARPRASATSPAPASTTPTCATPPPTTASAAPPSAPATPKRPRSNLGLGHDLRAGLIDPTDDQLDALRDDRLPPALPRDYRDVIAYGAGWTDPDRQQPVGDTGRHEPPPHRRDRRRRARARPRRPRPAARHRRSSSPAGPPRSSSTPTASPAPRRSAPSAWPASCATRCPAATSRCAPRVWAFLRPMLSPRLTELHRDAFVARRGRSSDRRPRRAPRRLRPRRPRPRRRGRQTRRRSTRGRGGPARYASANGRRGGVGETQHRIADCGVDPAAPRLAPRPSGITGPMGRTAPCLAELHRTPGPRSAAVFAGAGRVVLLNAGCGALFVVKGPMLGQVRRRPGLEPPTARRGEAIGQSVGSAGSMQRRAARRARGRTVEAARRP